MACLPLRLDHHYYLTRHRSPSGTYWNVHRADFSCFILDVPSLAKAIFKENDPYRHFLPLLKSNNTEDPIPLLTAHALARLMSTARDESRSTHQALPLMLSYLSGLAKSSDAGLQDIAVQEYSSLLFGSVSRGQFWDQRSETIEPLIKILHTAAGIGGNGNSTSSLWSGNSSSNNNNNRSANFEGSLATGVGLQLLYHVLLVIWQVSFESENIGDEMDEYVYPLFTPEDTSGDCQANVE